jgi:hypothetical protein
MVMIVHHIIKPFQAKFLPGRNILEGAGILHETLHELHIKKQKWVLLRYIFAKAYDKIK